MLPGVDNPPASAYDPAMARNVEAKLRVESLEEVRNRAEDLAETGSTRLHQTDWFFPVATGRLKLRVEHRPDPATADTGTRAELIAYQRNNDSVARISDYLRCPVADADLQRNVLQQALGTGPVIRKHRELFRVGRTRIHLDQVESLGCFVEIEVVLGDGEPAQSGLQEYDRITQALGLAEAVVEPVAYADLLEQLTG